jgi:hypothetical protein
MLKTQRLVSLFLLFGLLSLTHNLSALVIKVDNQSSTNSNVYVEPDMSIVASYPNVFAFSGCPKTTGDYEQICQLTSAQSVNNVINFVHHINSLSLCFYKNNAPNDDQVCDSAISSSDINICRYTFNDAGIVINKSGGYCSSISPSTPGENQDTTVTLNIH